MDKDSKRAAAELYRLVQATALLRVYRESEGHEAESPEAIAEWLKRHRGSIEPNEADYRAVERAHPDLATIARRGNPYLSGEN